jgi:uroporphyrin-III C-methyltransferase
MKKEVNQHFGQVILHELPPEPVALLNGLCTVVDACPAEPDLLTAPVRNAIREATVLLVEEWVGDAVVALASSTCRVVHVGERADGQSMPQAFVEKLILHAVREGHQVVHLKGAVHPALQVRSNSSSAR